MQFWTMQTYKQVASREEKVQEEDLRERPSRHLEDIVARTSAFSRR
jgi:hypothetical protein